MAATENEIEDAAKHLLEQQTRASYKIWHFKTNHDLQKGYAGLGNYERALVWKRYHELLKAEVKKIGSNRHVLEGHKELERKEA